MFPIEFIAFLTWETELYIICTSFPVESSVETADEET